jgi:hypothetical protein
VFPPPLHGRVDRAAPSDWEGIELANRRKSNCQGLWIKIFRTRIGSRARLIVKWLVQHRVVRGKVLARVVERRAVWAGRGLAPARAAAR